MKIETRFYLMYLFVEPKRSLKIFRRDADHRLKVCEYLLNFKIIQLQIIETIQLQQIVIPEFLISF